MVDFTFLRTLTVADKKDLRYSTCSMFSKKKLAHDEREIAGIVAKLNLTNTNITKLGAMMVVKCLKELPDNFTKKVAFPHIYAYRSLKKQQKTIRN